MTVVRSSTPASASAAAASAPLIGKLGEAAADGRGVPLALKQAKEAQKKAYLNADGSERLVSYDGRELPFGSASSSTLPAGSFSAQMRRMQNSRDAGNAVVTADNATLHTLTYCYGTHKPMEAWLTKVPADGQLKLNVILTPSVHAGSNDKEKNTNFELFAKTNRYNVEVIYPDGTRETHKFDVEGNSPPVHGSGNPSSRMVTATPSPDLTIDLNKWAGKGDVRIRGWADGSAGVEGYIEHRETVLHLGKA